MKKYLVTLTAAERQALHDLTAAGKASARKRAPARLLLKADQADGGPAWPDEHIAAALDGGLSPLARARRRSVEQGPQAARGRKPQDRPSRPRQLDGPAEARLIARACAAPPDGRPEWTVQLPAGQLVAPEVVGAVSDEAVRRALKKTSLSRGGKGRGASRRRRMPSSSARWRAPGRSTTAPTTRNGPWSARARPAGS